MDKRKGYSLDHPKLNKDKEVQIGAAYDNGIYVSDNDERSQSGKYQPCKASQSVEDPQFGTFKPSNSVTGINARSSKSSRNRTCILIAVVVIAVFVVIAAAGAVVAVVLLRGTDDSSAEPKTMERTVQKTIQGEAKMTSKTWMDVYEDKYTDEYKTLEIEFITLMDKKLQESVLADKYNGTFVKNMRKGSVIIEFESLFIVTLILIVEDNQVRPTQALDNVRGDDTELKLQVDVVAFQKIINEISHIEDAIVSDHDECSSYPCKNGGTCNDGVYKFSCKCKEGYKGFACEEDIDECRSSPCHNGGVCRNGLNNYTCECKDGTEGFNCEINEDNCRSSPCKNDAMCIDEINDFKCQCLPGYTGQDCADDINECDFGPCQNGGTCLDDIGKYICVCEPGWTGQQCQKNIDDCDGNLCSHGYCVDEVNGYFCVCEDGWMGQYCDEVFQRTSALPTSSTTINPSETCSSYTSLLTYAFNMTYLEPFSEELFNFASNAFIGLNQTLTGLFLDSARSENDDQWICLISLIKCAPTYSNYTTGDELFISAEVLISVPVNTISIHEAAYHFSQAALKSGILFLIDYRVYASTTTTSSTTTTTTKGTPSSVTTSKTISTTTTQQRTIPVNSCQGNEYQCLDGTTCIPASYVCDGWKDCSEREDERGCDCPETYCKFDGDCISEDVVCDGIFDCADQTDEQRCPIVCTPEQFTCRFIKECVDISLKCDGKKDCTDGTDEWYNCTPVSTPKPIPKEFEIRLMNGDTDTTAELYGRVEVRLVVDGKPAGEFGTICDDSWDRQEAVVLCRYFGASDPYNSFAYSEAAFGEGSGPIWLRNLHCNGGEEKLEDCKSSDWGDIHCSHQQDASISCGIDRLASMSTPSLTTADTTLKVTTSPPIQARDMRLVGGKFCLEGRIEVFHDGEWGTVCNRGFDEYEAHVVCKGLGFSTFYSYLINMDIGNSTGPIHLSYLNCNGSENSLSQCKHNGWGLHNCSHLEDQAVKCLGDPAIDCKTEPDAPNVNCTFNRSRCAYHTEVLSGNGKWLWKISDEVGLNDQKNSSSTRGGLMVYPNEMGSEGDKARLLSPPFSPTSTKMKVEFYYQLQTSSYNDLTFTLNEYRNILNNQEGDRRADNNGTMETEVIWNSLYLRQDQENQWLYECVQLTDLNISSNYSLVFTATHGPSAYTSVALDEISVTEGRCVESILDGMCDFDRPRTCGMTVDCLNCDKTKHTFSWMWKSNKTSPSVLDAQGRFMMVNSTFGSEGDEAIMRFAVPSLYNRTAFGFKCSTIGENIGHLEILLYMEGTFHTVISTISSNSRLWSKKCIPLPSDMTTDLPVTIALKVVHGGGNQGYIAVDDVYLAAEECPDPVSTCNKDMPQCGWKTYSNGQFQWKYFKDSEGQVGSTASNIRLVDGPDPSKGHVEILHNDVWGRVCDDKFGYEEAKVVCRMLGYPTVTVEYLEESPYGYTFDTRIWLDDLSCTGDEESLEDCDHNGWGINDCYVSEHVAVHCFGTPSGSNDFDKNFFVLSDPSSEASASSWASLSSRDIVHQGGKYRYIFDIFKFGGELLQVWYRNQNKTHILDKIFEPTDSKIKFCLDFADVTGEITVGLTAFKTSEDNVKTFVANFSLERGNCKESLIRCNFTFESDHMFYGYDVFTEMDESVCVPSYKWERIQAKDGYGIDTDKTFGDGTGHFMYVNSLYGQVGDTSDFNINQISAEESKGLCSLKFFYFINGETTEHYLEVIVNTFVTKLFGIPKVQIWLPGCVNLVNTCGDDPGSLDIQFHAVQVGAGIDDIVLSTDPCPETEEPNVSCDFENETVCRYFFDPAVWWHDKLLVSVSPDPGNYLVSPVFDTQVDSCVKVAFSSTSDFTIRLMIINLRGEIIATSEFLKVSSSISREIQEVIKPGAKLRLYFEAYYTSNVGFNRFAISNITLKDGKCENLGLSCDLVKDIECEGNCVTTDMICDGVRHCLDGADEHCECDDTTFNCTLTDECIAPGLLCDGFNDCNDGSDEVNCEPSVNCSFSHSGNFDCGYKLYNAEPGNDGIGLKTTSQLAFITSPDVIIYTNSCMSITVKFNAKSNIRVAAFDGEMYSVLHQASWQYVEITISVNVSVGYYKSFTIETRSDDVFGKHSVLIRNILLTDNACEEAATSSTTSTTKIPETTFWFDYTTAEDITELPTTNSSTPKDLTTPKPLPDDFPIISLSEPDPVSLGDHVILSCFVQHSQMYELILSWLVGDKEIFRNNELMLDKGYKTKYIIDMTNNSTGTNYDLTIYDVTKDDIKKDFTCLVDVIGYWPSNILKASTKIEKIDDGCFSLDDSDIEKFCETIGYDKVTTPSVSGFQTMDNIREAFGKLQDSLNDVQTDFNDKDQCYYPLHELMCGLHASKCDSGKVVSPVCREHCEEIADACMSLPFTYVYDRNSVAKHYCKYLPSKKDMKNCSEIWMGCGTNVILGNDNGISSSIRLRSQNFPNNSPDISPCVYSVNASSVYYSLKLSIQELNLTDNCSGSFLMINDDKLCFNNASQYTLSSEPSFVKLSLVSSTADLPTGFLITFVQEYPASLCDVFEVNFHIKTYEASSDVSSCTEWIFTSDDNRYSISLTFTELLDCVDLLDKDSELIQTICDLEAEIDVNRKTFVKVKSKSAHNIFKLQYNLVSTRDDYDFTITSVELLEGNSDNEGKVFITRSDGQSGYLCGFMNFGASNVICKMAGYASPSLHHLTKFRSHGDTTTKDIIMYDIACDGTEESILECNRQQWVDYCRSNLCLCYDDEGFRGVRCPLKTAQCNFTDHDCGYKYNNSQVKLTRSQKFGDGLFMTSTSYGDTGIHSPHFIYTSDKVVTFSYSFEGVTGEALAMTIRAKSGAEDFHIWQKPQYTVDGRYSACVNLPESLVGQEVQMIFTMSMQPSMKEHTIGLHNVSITADKCEEEFPRNKCTFTNINMCHELLSDLCTDAGFGMPVWKIRNNSLEGNSAYALQDKDYVVSFTSSTLDTSLFLRFKYELNGIGENENDLTLRVDFRTGSDNVNTLFSDSSSKNEGNICLSLPTNGDDKFQVDFVLRKSTSEGIILLDDIEMSEVICPHPISCDFEQSERCHYNIYNKEGHSWNVTSVDDDHTFGGQSKGHVIQVVTGQFPQDNSTPAVFTTPLAQLNLDRKYKCLAFFVKRNYGLEGSYRLDVIIFYPESNEMFTRKIEMLIPYVWQEVNIDVNVDKYSEAEFTFKATHLYGALKNPLAIDDIELHTTRCIDGLQDLDMCDFNTPGLCGFEVNCTINSGYSWRIYSQEINKHFTIPSTEADGHFMFLDSSFGTKGHESHFWFKVYLKDVRIAHYTFSYFMTHNGTGILRTFYRLADTNSYGGVSVVGFKEAGIWLQSECYELPPYFQGEIFFHSMRGYSMESDVAIDNVKITRKSCAVPSVACEFDENTCGYKPINSQWTLKDGYIITESQGALSLPIHTLNDLEFACISFIFESDNMNELIIETTMGLEYINYTYTVYSNGKQHGQIDCQSEIDEVKFIVPDDYLMKIDQVTITTGQCKEITCENSEFVCPLQCIPTESKCDRKIDCNKGLDESYCGFSIACQFNNGSNCGYASISESNTEWSVIESHSFILDGTEVTVNGGMFYTNMKGQPAQSSSSVTSIWQNVSGPSCVRFKYLGTIPVLLATITYRGSHNITMWNDTMASMTPTSWRTGQIETEFLGADSWIMFNLTASLLTANYTEEINEDPFIVIEDIEMLEGTCGNQDPPSCPENAPKHCNGFSHCYKADLQCDRKRYCPDGSDESPTLCASEFKIECDFEQDTVCGYELISNTYSKKWRRVGGDWYQIPPFDHTIQDKSGHFLLFVNWNNNHAMYDSTTAISPVQIFFEDGCVTFWYYLNSTAVHPSGLSAQILASVNYVDLGTTEFVWYDFVNRPIDSWIFGNFEVPGNQKLSVNFTAITSETFMAYPGVVALDDVSFTAGKCQVSQECSDETFSCRESGLCIPKTFICDGKYDCHDKSDEQNCDSRPDGSFQLVGGDGTYGQLQYYLDGSWRAVCFPPAVSGSDSFNYITTQRVCEQLGFHGNTEMYEYRLRHTLTQPISLTCIDTGCSHILCSVSYSTKFAGIKCSKTACFSGTKLCPGTADVCRPTKFFCNGNPDCPGNTDETECCCHEGDEYCTRTPDESKEKKCVRCKEKDMFECQSHQCINKDKVCDGNKDCLDGTDEYRCVQIKENEVTVYYESEMVPVCYNNIGRLEAETLCSLSGRGLLANRGIQHGHTEVTGILLIKSDSSGTILPGLDFGQKRPCYPLVLKCELPECGTSSIVDNFLSPLIPYGNKAVLGARPYHGSLRKDEDLHCGCTVIGGQWVLTAAHCVEYKYTNAYTVILGSIESDKVGEHGQQFSVIEIVSHPNYDADDVSKGYDVALIKLSHAPNFDNYTRPACLGTKTSWQYILDLSDKAECYITGFGANELYLARDENLDKVLAESRVGIIDREACQEKFTAAGTGDVSPDGICVENRQPYQSACFGDSGGPLVCRNEIGRWELFGDLSYGSSGCRYDTPSIYHDVTSQRDWIESVTGLKFQDEYKPVYDSKDTS